MRRPGALDTGPTLADWEARGEHILQCIRDRDFDTLAAQFDPEVTCRLLVPAGLQTPGDVPNLIDTLRGWFGVADRFDVENSYVSRVVDRLHIGYQIRLHEEGQWFRLEQQAYISFADDKIVRFDLICSGFRFDEPRARDNGGALMRDRALTNGGESLPHADALLEMLGTDETGAPACALLTPAIKASLKELAPGQVLLVRVDDPSAVLDVTAWCSLTGNPLVDSSEQDGVYSFSIRKKDVG